MDTERLLHLLDAGDLSVWPPLARAVERRVDAQTAAAALTSLHTVRGGEVEAARWLAKVADDEDGQALRAALLTCAEGWRPSPLRALTQDLLRRAFRLIPAGAFVMGSPSSEPGRLENEGQRLVEITRPFLLKATPVTQAEWWALMGNNPSGFPGDARRPVEQVSWFDAVACCAALSEREGVAGAYALSAARGKPGVSRYSASVSWGGVAAPGYRLPTEAEWEYAYRAGTTTAFYHADYPSPADQDPNLAAIGWYQTNAHSTTQPVAQKRPNAWGLYDMAGNVWEYCQDGYQRDLLRDAPSPARDPCAPDTRTERVIRGGAWFCVALYCRAAQRYNFRTSDRNNSVGFRPARSLG
jgi:formylglycine-generating enzyme required for sulfatase activity